MSLEIEVKVIPRSSRPRWEWESEERLKVWVHAAPTDGQANAELAERIAEGARLPKSAVSIVRGATGRIKRLRIEGIELSELRKRLS